MNARLSLRSPALLLLAVTLGALGCNVVDPFDLKGFPDTCRTREQCADGFICVEGHCITAAGAECREGFPSTPCEYSLGVCAGDQRACLPNGRSEATCGVASYGEAFEPLESNCDDGLDNDCDGLAETRRAQPLTLALDAATARSTSETRVVRLGSGYLVAWTDTAFVPGPGWRLRLNYRLTDAALKPVGPAGELESLSTLTIQHPSPTPGGTPISIYPALNDVQLTPYEGGAFVTWYAYDTAADVAFRRVARLDVVAGQLTLGIPPRDLSFVVANPETRVRTAVAADRSSVLFVWPDASTLQGQAFDLGLRARSEAVSLDAPLSEAAPELFTGRFDLAPNGTSDFALGWSALRSQDSTRVVRFRTLSGTLGTRGEVVGSDVAGDLYDLRLVAALQPEGQPLAAWLARPDSVRSQGTVGAAAAAAGIGVAQPFAADGSAVAPVSVPDNVVSLNVVRDGDTLLFAYPTWSSTAGNATLLLRRIGLDGASQELPLSSAPQVAGSTVSVLPDVTPGLWTAVFTADGKSQIAATCRR